MAGGLCGAGLLDGLLSDLAAYSNSSSHQDDVTLLTLDLTATVVT